MNKFKLDLPNDGLALHRFLAELEEDMIRQALERTMGNCTHRQDAGDEDG